MKKVVITILVLMCSQAFGLSFMGPPKAELKQGQYSLGLDYTFSEMDIKFSGYGDSDTDEVETNMLFVNLGYGNTDNWEIYLRLGFSKLEADEPDDFDGDNEFAYGFGTKFTFAEQDAISWGSLFQIGWFKGKDKITGFLPGYGILTADQEIDAYEIQIAVGPTYEVDSFKIYGGPFFHFIDGDYDFDIAGIGSLSYDIEEESVFGGYIGLSKDLTNNSNIGVEFQFTGDAQAVGLRYVRRF